VGYINFRNCRILQILAVNNCVQRKQKNSFVYVSFPEVSQLVGSLCIKYFGGSSFTQPFTVKGSRWGGWILPFFEIHPTAVQCWNSYPNNCTIMFLHDTHCFSTLSLHVRIHVQCIQWLESLKKKKLCVLHMWSFPLLHTHISALLLRFPPYPCQIIYALAVQPNLQVM